MATKVVSYNGETYNVPSTATNADILEFLGQYDSNVAENGEIRQNADGSLEVVIRGQNKG